MKRIIKDPTYNIYSKGGSVETRKNRLTKEDLKLLASESPREEFELARIKIDLKLSELR